MNQFKISTRLIVLIGSMAVLLIAIGLTGLLGISRSNAALQTVYADRTVPMGQIAEIQQLLLRNRLAIVNSLIDQQPQFTQANAADEVEANTARIGKVWANYMATYLTSEESALAKKFDEERSRFVQEGLRPAVAALRSSDMGETHRIVVEKIRPLFPPVATSIEALMQLQLDVAQQEYEQAVARYTVIRAVAIAAIAGGLLFSVLFGLALVRGITRSLKEAITATHAVSQGDLQHRIQVLGRDEVAQLLTALQNMQDNLTRVVSSVRQGAESVATASTQIAQGNTDLSARTESQASALEETAASME